MPQHAMSQSILDATGANFLCDYRTVHTQTDPVSTSDEEDFLLDDEEDLYEELDLPE